MVPLPDGPEVEVKLGVTVFQTKKFMPKESQTEKSLKNCCLVLEIWSHFLQEAIFYHEEDDCTDTNESRGNSPSK